MTTGRCGWEPVRGLGAMLRVRARAVAPCVSSAARSVQQPSCDDFADGTDGVRSDTGVLRVYSGGAETAHATAGASKGIMGLLEGMESDGSKNRARVINVIATAESAAMTGQVGSSSAHATAGESEGIIGSLKLSEFEFPFFEFVRSWVVVICMCTPCCPFCCYCVCTCLPWFFFFCCVCCCCTHACFCMVHVLIRGRTRVVHRVPREG